MSSGRLELTWPGKDRFLLAPADETGKPVWVERDHPAAGEVRTLGPVAHIGDGSTDGLVISGDSLYGLRALCEVPEWRRKYRGKVSLIYIDPPFNTGEAFIQYDDWMEHSVWLSFMRERLLLMRELLAPNGTIWVHLDDVEQHRMRLLLDEVFGAQNFIATVVWQKAYSPKNSARHLSVDQDYITIYAVNAEVWRPVELPRTAEMDFLYGNPDNDPRGPWTSGDLLANKSYSLGIYPITTPSGRVIDGPAPGRYWRVSEEKLRELDADNRIWWGKDGNGNPRLKRFLTDVRGRVPQTWWPHPEVGHSQTGKDEIKALFPGDVPFSTPKPERLLERILHIGSQPGDIVLDAFGGSGATAATAQKMRRQWVTMEVSQSTVDEFIVPRLTKVIEGRDPGGITKATGWAGGGAFDVATVGPSMYEVDDDMVLLADWAHGEPFARTVAAQLGFTYAPDGGPFTGARGRMRLAVVDGQVGPEEVRDIVGALGDGLKVTIVTKVVLPGAEEALAQASPGSRIRKAPRDLLTDPARRRVARRRDRG